MRTAALLPSSGNPYLLLYWLRNFERVWHEAIDELHVTVSTQTMPDELCHERIRRELRPETDVLHVLEGHWDHGRSLDHMVESTDADAVVLCEDDAFVRRGDGVREAFDFLRRDEADVVCSPRGSMTPNLVLAAHERWGEYRFVGDEPFNGHGMWPAFVFARRDALRSTDRHYGPKGWGPGETVPGIGWTVPPGEEAVADTFGNTAFQLRDRFRVHQLPQWKGPWLWEFHLDRGMDPQWFHCGSLSSGMYDWVADEPSFMSGGRETDEMSALEWGHRLYWWSRAFTKTRDSFPERADAYLRNFTALQEEKVDWGKIQHWVPVCDRMVSWDDGPA